MNTVRNNITNIILVTGRMHQILKSIYIINRRGLEKKQATGNVLSCPEERTCFPLGLPLINSLSFSGFHALKMRYCLPFDKPEFRKLLQNDSCY